MTVKSAEATWNGTLKAGKGHLKLESGVYEGGYTFAGRFENGKGTNPEELIAAAHSGCYTMFLSALLSEKGLDPERLHTTAKVHLGAGPTVTKIELFLEAQVSGISEEDLRATAQEAKEKCPISKLLAAVPEMTLDIKVL
ncbi:OsmC family protein [Deinococcus roseus]|uniref:Peroxiredoxin n=1 Tax=Deinococcus roseus TaxID=392414 RepID=A0ABQ2D1K5_9DEIO|nr:OsmC family protein [Deinococcus roseus]GGJ41817.1 peroxiredoxin [Deinococcus roseus]